MGEAEAELERLHSLWDFNNPQRYASLIQEALERLADARTKLRRVQAKVGRSGDEGQS